MAAAPTFLIIRSDSSQRRFAEFCDVAGPAVSAAGGQLVAARPCQTLRVLEAGSRAWHTWIARYPDPDVARANLAALPRDGLRGAGEAQVLLAPGLPAPLPPELAHLPAPRDDQGAETQPPTLMLIEGDAWDDAAMGRYRDIILPLLTSLGGHYHVYTPGAAVTVLGGDWGRGFLALSRWPAAHAADAFWLAEAYQGAAIPARTGAGRFEVVTCVGERD